jgi:tetratricopeptide (TPR) repeat protein
MMVSSCADTHERGIQSAATLDLRTACLRKRRQALKALTHRLVEADAAAVPRAVQAAIDLPPIADCADVDALRAASPPRHEDARTEALRGELADARALHKLGRYREARDLAEKTMGEVAARGDLPFLAEALFDTALFEEGAGSAPTSELFLRQAAEVAARAHEPLVHARAVGRMVWIVGVIQGRFADAVAVIPYARQALALAGDDTRARGELLSNIGGLRSRMGDYAEARADLEEAVRIDLELNPDGADAARALGNLGVLALRQSDPETARGYLQRVLEMQQRVLGPAHPDLARTLANLGIVALDVGDADAAAAAFDRARGLFEQQLGPRHPLVASMLDALSWAEHARGDYAHGLEVARRGLEIREQVPGVDPTDLGESYLHIGALEMRVDVPDPAHALDHLRRGLAPLLRAYGDDHPYVVEARRYLGEALAVTGDRAAARVELERAVPGAHNDPLSRADLDAVLIVIALDDGRIDDARVLADDALDAIAHVTHTDGNIFGEVLLAAGRARLAEARGGEAAALFTRAAYVLDKREAFAPRAALARFGAVISTYLADIQMP